MVEYAVNDIVKMKKPHPCGSNRWKVIRVGADVKIECQRCGHIVMMNRYSFGKQIKEVEHLIDSNKSSVSSTASLDFKTANGVANLIGEFITRSNLNNCRRNGHDLRGIRGWVPVLVNGKREPILIEVPAVWCNECRRYYMLEKDYQCIRNQGTILCKIVEENYWTTRKSGDFGKSLSDESVIHSLGYNVNTRTKLSGNDRKIILTNILKYGVLTKAEVCAHLDYLIKRGEHNAHIQQAVKKWKQDRQYVVGLKVDDPKVTTQQLRVKNFNYV